MTTISTSLNVHHASENVSVSRLDIGSLVVDIGKCPNQITLYFDQAVGGPQEWKDFITPVNHFLAEEARVEADRLEAELLGKPDVNHEN